MKTKLAILSAICFSTSSLTYAKDLAEEKDMKCFALYDVATYFFDQGGTDIAAYPWMIKVAAVHSGMEPKIKQKYVEKMGVQQETLTAAFTRAKKTYMAERLMPVLESASPENVKPAGMKRLKADIDSASCK